MTRVDSASNRNEYQEYFLGKGVQCLGLTTLPPSCADCLKLWEPHPLETSEPVKACSGIASPLFVMRRGALSLYWPATINIAGANSRGSYISAELSHCCIVFQ
jgi:hypothetical protein